MLKPVSVSTDGWNFVTSDGSYVSPIGGNMLNDQHPGQGTLFDEFDLADVEKRFAAMQELGLNCLRQAIGVNRVFDPKTGLKAEGMKNWDAFIECADKHGVYLMPVGGYVGGNDWFDVALLAGSGKALDESCAFWSAFVGHYKDHPAIWSWDLRNELLYDTKEHMTVERDVDVNPIEVMLKADWPSWLKRKFGSVQTMNRFYQSDYASFEEVPGSIRFVEKPYDACAADFRHYLNDRGYAWCKAQVEAIREAAPAHMVCSGNNTWLSPDQDLWLSNGFHNRSAHDLFDFITHHPYPALQVLPENRGDPLDGGEPMIYWLNSCIAMSRLEYFGKPVVLQEYGWYGGGESRFLCPLPYRSEQEHADYTRTLVETLIPHINGFINWPLMDMPASNDISNHGGIFTHDVKPKALAEVYGWMAKQLNGKRLERALGTTTLEYSLLELYTTRAGTDRFFDEAHEVIQAGEIPDFKFLL